MIILPLFFSILVILPAPTNQDPTIASKKSKVDWTQCSETAQCVCVENKPNKLITLTAPVPASTGATTESEGVCNIGIQSKFFDENFALFQLQVIGGPQLDNDPQLMLYREKAQQPSEPEQLFGCKLNSQKNVELIGDPTILKKFKIKLFERRSFFDSDHILCAVTVRKAIEFSTDMLNSDKYKGKGTVMKFLGVDYIHEEKGNFLFAASPEGRKCDPYLFNDLSESQNFIVQPIINRDHDILNCDNYNSESSSYTMRYDYNGKTGLEMKQLVCDKDVTGTFNYKLVNDLDAPDAEGNIILSEEVRTPDSYTFYCAANIDESCQDPNPNCDHATDPKCPQFIAGSKGVAAKLTCPGNKWLINGEYYVLTVEPACKRDKISSENKAAFHFTLPSGKTGTNPEARCFVDYECKSKSKLFLPYCGDDDETKCGSADDNNGILKCKNATKQMTVTAREPGSVAWNLSSYQCNPATGLYGNGSVVLSARSRVRCLDVKETPPEIKAQFSDAEIIVFIAGAVVVILVILGAIVLAVYCYCKVSKTIRKREKKYWIKISGASRIARCREDFAKVLEAEFDTATHILVGLDRMELLLDTETEEAECWEEVYKFVERLQGALQLLDAPIWHMFNRYMHIRAQKIITKHTWLASKKITTDNPTGLMRAVAIRLLSFAMNDPKNTETEDLIASGYSQLGFKAVEQYPHCGVMWSLIMHARKIHKEGDKLSRLNCPKFLEALMKIAAGNAKMTMPKEDVIPLFGTIEEQAAYAIGGTPILTFHMANSKKFLLGDNGAVAKSYFKGLGDALWRFSMQIILGAFAMWPDPNPEFLAKVRKDAPEAVWNDLALAGVKVMMYYGLPLDAQRMYMRFLQKKPLTELKDMQVEQKHFEDAVDKVREELRAWFAERTDKEELKKKPDYIVNANLKSEDRVVSLCGKVAEGAPANDPTASDNNNISATPSSGGGTNSTEPGKIQAASDPKDAAATPAAAAPQA